MKADRSLRRFIWLVLALNIGVILWGAYVRASGSGAGCGSHWPLCNGVVIPRAARVETIIEFIHRGTSGLALVSVVVLWIWVQRKSLSNQLRRTSHFVLIFMLLEALIGAGLVLFELVGENPSLTRALSGALHLANTFLLLGSITLAGWLASTGRTISFSAHRQSMLWLVVGLIGLILIGSSGAIAALGDTLYPSASLQEGLQAELTATAHFLVRLRVAHPVIAVLVSAYLYGLSRIRSEEPTPTLLNATLSLRLALLVQLLAGVFNWLLLAPIWLQIVHLLLADLTLLSFCWVAFERLSTVEPSESHLVEIPS